MVNNGVLQLLGSCPGICCVCSAMPAIRAAREPTVAVQKAKAPPGVLRAATRRVPI